MTLQNVGLFKSRKMLARIATNSSQWSRYLAAVVDTETFLSPISSFDERSYPLKPALDDRLGVALPEVAVEQLERKRSVVADGTEVGNHLREIGDSVANHDAVVVGLRERVGDLPDNEMKRIADYVDSGRPIVGLRTATHALQDLQSEGTRRMLVNACYWAVGIEDKIPDKSDVTFVGDYTPQPFGFGAHKKGVKPSDPAGE